VSESGRKVINWLIEYVSSGKVSESGRKVINRQVEIKLSDQLSKRGRKKVHRLVVVLNNKTSECWWKEGRKFIVMLRIENDKGQLDSTGRDGKSRGNSCVLWRQCDHSH
jgi:hypothetical protein